MIILSIIENISFLLMVQTQTMGQEKNKKQNQLNIELTEEMSEGVYSNLAIISHSHSEFVFDFVRMLPNVPKAKVKSRVIMTPEHAKRFLKALHDNLQKYEKLHGTVKEKKQEPNIPLNFTPTAQA